MSFTNYLTGMGAEKTLDQAEIEIKSIALECNDAVIDTLDFRYNGDTLGLPGTELRFGFTDTGLDQFGRFLGVKAHFFKKLRSGTREAVFNDVLVDAHDLMPKAKIRLYDGNVRAVLGSEYTPISGTMIIKEFRAAGFQNESLSLRVYADYESTDIILLSKEEIFKISEEEIYHAGMILRNDDVGKRAATIQSYLYNRVNNVGIIGGTKLRSSFKYNHTKNIEARVSEGVVYSVQQFVKWFENAGEQIGKLTATKALEKERLIPVLKSTQIRDKEVEAIFTMGKLVQDGYTVWDLVNTISLYASIIEDRERTFELMGYAGMIMADPKPFAVFWE